jgi:hypothetical protein
VGIDGLTAAGKTSLGHELAERISSTGRPVLRASLDDFKKPWRDFDPEVSLHRVGRDEDWAGSDAEAVHRDRYHVSEQLYLAEVDPVRLVDVVIDNSDFDRPRIVLER